MIKLFMNGEKEFLTRFPECIYVSVDNAKAIEFLLKKNKILQENEEIDRLSIAGEGNMNIVLRAKTNQRSFIIKQSRPWVAKYPQITAPIERVNVEAEFIKLTLQHDDLNQYSPILIGHIPSHFLLILEDLGEISDFSVVYQGAKVTSEDLSNFATYLDALHAIEVLYFPDNLEMRTLNHEHIFHFPFQKDNGLNLDEIQQGLANAAMPVIENLILINRIAELGKVYLKNDHKRLIHGDFYPASFLKTNSGIKVIDAEFAFLGPKEFDWAVLLAHLMMSDQPVEVVNEFVSLFTPNRNLDTQLILAFAGVEILRRLLGVAQLPLNTTIAKKTVWIDNSINWIMN